MQSNTQNRAISKFDVMRGGKVKETFDTYEQAWAYASKYRGAVVRYNISKNKQTMKGRASVLFYFLESPGRDSLKG